jgi:ABC-2 type transport system permease protein
MSAEGTVYDLGYTPHEGRRLGRAGAFRAMVVDGARKALGLRRKAWAKVLPWALIGSAIVPAAWLVALTFLFDGFGVEEMGGFASPSELFEVLGSLSMLFMALVTPVLLIPDRVNGVLSIYASRPVRAGDYLLARAATVAILTSLFILIPQATMFIGVSALNVNGIWAGLSENASQIPEILGTTVALVVGYGAPAFLVSLYMKRVAMAAGVYVVTMFMTAALTDALPRASELLIFKVLAPFSLFFNPFSVRDWLFTEEVADSGFPLARVDLSPWIGAVAILVVAAITTVLAVRQYRKEI